MSRLLKDIEAGEIENLIVYKRDRLARTSKDYMEIYYKLKAHNVNVHFTSDSEYPMSYTNLSEFIELILSGMVEHEVQQMKERIAHTVFDKFENGINLGHLPFGYKKEEMKSDETEKEYEQRVKRIEKVDGDPNEIQVIQELYSFIVNDAYPTMNAVMKAANKKGLRTRKGNYWTVKGIKDLFSNSILYGERYVTFNKIPFPAYRKTPETAIFSKEEWDLAQEMMELKSSKRGLKPKATFFFLLEDNLYCSDCGSKMKGRAGEIRGTVVGKYFCECKSKRGLLKREIEQIVIEKADLVIRQILHDNTESFVRRYKKDEMKKLDQKLAHTQSEIDKQNKAFISRTEKWLKTIGVEKRKSRAELLEKKKEIDELRKHYQAIETEKDKLNQFCEQMIAHQKWFRDHAILSKVKDEKEIKARIQDFITKVEVVGRNTDQTELHITFKHPFTHFKEVLAVEA